MIFWLRFRAFFYGVFHPFMSDKEIQEYATKAVEQYMKKISRKTEKP
jgi:hypothetical protein